MVSERWKMKEVDKNECLKNGYVFHTSIKSAFPQLYYQRFSFKLVNFSRSYARKHNDTGFMRRIIVN